ncbi:Uncharacterised protein [Vibrio cholerae]|nr:Uncharacterised protein [Vibrio cholerae]CSI28551.1 Uncharacterised protein [Vibrio cholerae]CSI84255.1 Uncharacterised protein [Vibrio cholerae]
MPDQIFCRNIWAKVARFWSHIAVSELKPSSRKHF